ncbi:hypothetical protein AAH450_07890 [Erwinia sp. P7711]|uniref:hypothetical protein n=1 Tax=Erwinia sp. P7711 TaxID=3141451 RepID=UPI00319B3CA3
MVNRVLSRYKTGAPKDALKDGEERLINSGPLYPDLLENLDRCQVNSVTTNTNNFMTLHMIDLGDLRGFAKLALSQGEYLNSQWCNGNAPKGIFACDAYIVPAPLYTPQERREMTTLMYVKLCITDTGNTVAVISLHDSTKTKDFS